MINTGLLTVDVLAVLELTSGQFVGDGVKPDGAGWLGGEPNTGVFAPYSVLAVAGAVTRDVPLSYAETVRSWRVTFRIAHYGASRSQCDFVAFRVRDSVGALLLTQSGDFRVSGAAWSGLGSMTRDDSVNPALWSASDSINLMLDS